MRTGASARIPLASRSNPEPAALGPRLAIRIAPLPPSAPGPLPGATVLGSTDRHRAARPEGVVPADSGRDGLGDVGELPGEFLAGNGYRERQEAVDGLRNHLEHGGYPGRPPPGGHEEGVVEQRVAGTDDEPGRRHRGQ